VFLLRSAYTSQVVPIEGHLSVIDREWRAVWFKAAQWGEGSYCGISGARPQFLFHKGSFVRRRIGVCFSSSDTPLEQRPQWSPLSGIRDMIP